MAMDRISVREATSGGGTYTMRPIRPVRVQTYVDGSQRKGVRRKSVRIISILLGNIECHKPP
jgi:hypothetical protein